jgi:hypothetical protein
VAQHRRQQRNPLFQTFAAMTIARSSRQSALVHD